jgi:hypothetical protein
MLCPAGRPVSGDRYGIASTTVRLHLTHWFRLSERLTADLAVEIIGSLKYYFDASRGKPGTRATTRKDAVGPGKKMDFGTAFGVYQPRAETDRQSGVSRVREPESSYDEAIRLAPYGYGHSPDPSDGA